MSAHVISSPAMIEDDDLLSLGSLSDLFVFDEDISITSDVNGDLSTSMHQRKSTLKRRLPTTTMTKNQPRMVSVESMSQVSTSSASASSRMTPLDSLKQLVSKKQQQRLGGDKRYGAFTQGNNKLASVFSKPSDFLRQAIQKRSANGNDTAPVAKKRRTTTTTTKTASRSCNPSALHEACRRGPELSLFELEAILNQDPSAALRPIRLMTTKKVYNPVTCRLDDKVIPEPYMYPLNLAISYKASSVVLERLVSAAPQVMTFPDNKSRSLHILLRHKPTDSVSADMMLLKQPLISSWLDSQQNSALHTAVWNGACFQTIRHLVALHPDALLQRNFHGQTPLDLAQRQGIICSTDVATYLWDQVQEQF